MGCGSSKGNVITPDKAHGQADGESTGLGLERAKSTREI